ncbi:MAG: CoA-binding protein [Candidatus Aenigmarchaeota archaeon]|nr:CoA-binding protein [Candidatus Aenigmarchaeota archaeon]
MMNNFINKTQTYAIVGASNNPEKYGYKVTKHLKESGHKVIPINPKEQKIQGIKACKTLNDCNTKIDTVIFIVPPAVTEQVLKDMPKQIRKVWMQPGSESEKAINYCKDNSIECTHNTCLLKITE